MPVTFSGPLSTVSNNKVFDDCSCQLTCTITRDPAPGSQLIERVELIAGGNPSSIVSIKGVSYTTPTGPPMTFTMSGSDPSADIVFDIKAPVALGAIDNLFLEVDWRRGTNSGTDIFPITLENLNPVLYWTPLLATGHDFGNIPVGSTGQTSFNFSNPTICDADFLIGTGGGCSDVTFNQPSSWTIPAGTNQNIVIDWTPSAPGSLACSLNFTLCESVTYLNLTGFSIVASDCLSCVNIFLKTENDYLSSSPGLCNDFQGGNYYQRAAIGEKKTVIFDFYYSTGLVNGLELWFNPELFGDICDFAAKYPGGILNSAPPVGYYINFFTGIGSSLMTLIGAGPATNSQRNSKATFIEGTSANFFSIEFEFFLTEDINDWLNSVTIQNQQRLLKSSTFAASNFTNSTPSVYNQIKKACFLFYLRDPSILVPDPFGPDQPFTCFDERQISLSARFYNQGLFAGPSEFTNEQLNLIRGGSPVTNFSSFANTEVTFTIDAPSGQLLDNCIFWLIDTNNFDNSIDFTSNYDSSRAEIITQGGLLDNHLNGASIGPVNIGGDTFEVKATVDNSVQVGQQFYLIAVTYSQGANLPNSFIFGPFNVTDQPGIEDLCCETETVHRFGNYNRDYTTDCYLPTVKERIKSYLSIKGGDFADVCLIALGLPVVKRNTWLEYLSSIDLLIYRKIEDFPVIGQTTFFVFGKYRSERTPGFPGNWNNLNAPFDVSDTGTLFLPEPVVETYFSTRVRYEDTVPPIEVLVSDNSTPYQRASAGALSSVYISTNGVSFDWANEEIFFEYSINFDVSSLVGSPLEITQVKKTKIRPFNFEAERGFVGLDEIKFFYPLDGDPTKVGKEVFGAFCVDSYNHIFVRTHKITGNDLNLIATIDRVPVGINNLVEEESYPSSASIPLIQLDTPEIFDADQVFENLSGFAWFKIDISELGPGEFVVCSIGIVK